jgi:uncharacterized protein (DUF1330 family)
MAAYFIVDIEVRDANGLQEYREQVPATVQKYGGRYLVRAGRWEVVEGNWKPKRIVVLEFPSVEQAKRWYDSQDYRRWKTQRQKASESNVILVEGVEA